MLTNVEKAISKFNNDLKVLFGSRVIDIIIYGSVVRGGFNKNRSDIDFIVFLKDEITTVDAKSIIELHKKYRSIGKLTSLLEGRYLGLVDNKFINGFYVGTNPEGWINIDEIGFSNIESAMILDCYMTLYDSNILPSIIEYDWIKVHEEIVNQIDKFIDNDLLSDNQRFVEYALITSARSLYTYKEDAFISKQKALKWIEHNYMILDYNNPKESLNKIRNLLGR
ncbi:MAG: nucleotidyltransferase domain-containing protein [Candidatus Izimaplasma sp.]|nr:nucleotidyltransferase domain-containing protein [Candidatus Izimaplasma bacterium]